MTVKINAYSAEEKRAWNLLLNEMWMKDFYFTNDYYRLSCSEKDQPVLFSYQNSDYKIIVPLIKRIIPDSPYYDATSVYGYAGPLSSHDTVPKDILNDFNEYFIDYMNESAIISVFSRLHPIINNDKYIYKLGEVVPMSQTVYIDLKQNPSEQTGQYRKGIKSDLNRLLKEGFEVFEDKDLYNINSFIDIYNENMLRVNAEPQYYFSSDYFINFFSSDEINAKLYFVRKGKELIAGSVFTFINGIIQYHLSGTKEGFKRYSPGKLIIDYIRQLGIKHDYYYLHLGGGVGSSNDSLFEFKAGFSKSRLDFKVWKYIVNRTIYNELVESNNISEEENYFPLYRAKNKSL